mgnify:CR=1 FL=1
MFALSKRLTDAFSLRFARAVRETYREDEAYASTPLGRLALYAFLLLLLLLSIWQLGPSPWQLGAVVFVLWARHGLRARSSSYLAR